MTDKKLPFGLKKSKPKQKRRPASPEATAKRIANLRRGNPGNKGGGLKNDERVEAMAYIRSNLVEVARSQVQLSRKENLTYSDKVRFQINEALLDRGGGRAHQTFAAQVHQHHTGLDGTTFFEGAGMTPLLEAAHAYDANEAKQLRSPKAIDVVAEQVTEQPDFIADAAGIIAAPAASTASAAPPPDPEPVEPVEEAGASTKGKGCGGTKS